MLQGIFKLNFIVENQICSFKHRELHTFAVNIANILKYIYIYLYIHIQFPLLHGSCSNLLRILCTKVENIETWWLDM